MACLRTNPPKPVDRGHLHVHTSTSWYVNTITTNKQTSDSHLAGSVQQIAGIPADVKDVFLTAWEIDPMTIIDMAADRGPFIDQTQSMSLHVMSPTPDSLVRSILLPPPHVTLLLVTLLLIIYSQLILQMHAWTRGLKTSLSGPHISPCIRCWRSTRQ